MKTVITTQLELAAGPFGGAATPICGITSGAVRDATFASAAGHRIKAMAVTGTNAWPSSPPDGRSG